MKNYRYEAYDNQGGKYQGELEGTDKQHILKQLQTQGLHASDINEVFQVQGLSFNLFKKKISLQQLEYFTSELSLLLKNGVKIDRALAILSQNNQSGPEGKLISYLLTSVRRGQLLSDAMSEHGSTFDALYISLVKLGEASGDLANVFARLSADLRFQRSLRDKIIQALTYPMIIFMVCVLCILFVFNYIVPQMSGLFSGMADLPSYTVALLNVSQWFQDYQWSLFIGLLCSILLMIQLLKLPIWRKRFSHMLMRIPLVNSMLLFAEQIRFNSALSMLSTEGVALDKAISLAANAIKNAHLQQEINLAQQKIRKGTKLSQALSMSRLFPSFSISLLEVGEESGDLPPVFDELAARAKSQFERAINKITSVLEPLLILVMGGIVGSVVVTMLLSIVSVNDVGF